MLYKGCDFSYKSFNDKMQVITEMAVIRQLFYILWNVINILFWHGSFLTIHAHEDMDIPGN